MRGEFVLGGREESAGGETCPMRGRTGVGREESAGGETCPMRGRTGVGREESAGDETCPRGGGRARGEWSLLAVRPVHAGEGERGERGVCWQ